MTIETKYNMHETVRVSELNRNGVVLDYCFDGDGLTYRVRYFESAKPETVYFMESELEPATIKKSIGLSS